MGVWRVLGNGQKRAFITHPERSFRVPEDWNSASNLIECIGGGASGDEASGGGGGAYARSLNMSVSGEIDVTVAPGSGGSPTIFNNGSLIAASASGPVGGAKEDSVGDIVGSGGNGHELGGGGGAAGPEADGLWAESRDGAAANDGQGGAGGVDGPGEVGFEWGDIGTGGGGSIGYAGGAYGGGGGKGGGAGAPGLIVVTYTPA